MRTDAGKFLKTVGERSAAHAHLACYQWYGEISVAYVSVYILTYPFKQVVTVFAYERRYIVYKVFIISSCVRIFRFRRYIYAHTTAMPPVTRSPVSI